MLFDTVLGSVAFGAAAWRYLRISQREHYEPGRPARIARLWLRRRPPNAWIVGAAGVLIGMRIATGIAPWVLCGTAGAILTAFPYGLGIKGTTPFKLTPRARRLAAATALIGFPTVTAVASVDGPLAFTTAPVVGLAAVELAQRAVRPIERRLARRFRSEATETLRRIQPSIVAITGSYGKTTTKEHVKQLLGVQFSTYASPASWNNSMGLSRAVNEGMAPGIEWFVAEMGTYGKGEIAELVSWVPPTIAVICALGPVHLERMGSLRDIAEAKSEIFTGAAHAVICIDDDLLEEVAMPAARTAGAAITTVSTKGKPADIEVERAGSELVVRASGEEVGTAPADGLHAANVGCAVAVALRAGVSRERISTALGGLTASASRATVQSSASGITVIDDTFNSNPAGAMHALALLTSQPAGRRFVITPGMIELGREQHERNAQFGRAVREADATLVVVGWTNRRALVDGYGADAVTVRDRHAARSWLSSNAHEGDAVLWENDLPDHYP